MCLCEVKNESSLLSEKEKNPVLLERNAWYQWQNGSGSAHTHTSFMMDDLLCFMGFRKQVVCVCEEMKSKWKKGFYSSSSLLLDICIKIKMVGKVVNLETENKCVRNIFCGEAVEDG